VARTSAVNSKKVVGVLALQGAFASHQVVLNRLSVRSHQIRTPQDLAMVDALIMPGGESTTMSKILESSELFEPIKKLVNEGMPVFGTCAGMILLASKIIDGRDDQVSLNAIDIEVQRNAYGRQLDSFEADIVIDNAESFHAVFIRAPRIIKSALTVEVLAKYNDDIVLAKQKNVMVASFHPELSSDVRVHEIFINRI